MHMHMHMTKLWPGWRALWALCSLGLTVPPAWAQAPKQAPKQAAIASATSPATSPTTPALLRLNVVGGLAALNQYTRHEEPFWNSELARLSGGRFVANVVPQDRAGIRGAELLGLVQNGAVAIGTVLVNLSTNVPELTSIDLAGMNPDLGALRRAVGALRPQVTRLLRQRLGVEALAIFVYPAQVIYCNKEFVGLRALKGRRIRTSSATISDFLEGLGAVPVPTTFSEIVGNAQAGNIDCAVTGTMSGNTIGLHDHMTHMHSMAITWGLSVVVANGAVWQSLPPELLVLLAKELPRLEERIWAEVERETGMGVLCNTGASDCVGGRRGKMKLVATTPDDDIFRREIFAGTVLPRWVKRCGPGCDTAWSGALAAALGVAVK